MSKHQHAKLTLTSSLGPLGSHVLGGCVLHPSEQRLPGPARRWGEELPLDGRAGGVGAAVGAVHGGGADQQSPGPVR